LFASWIANDSLPFPRLLVSVVEVVVEAGVGGAAGMIFAMVA
jgi:hypothetical protein